MTPPLGFHVVQKGDLMRPQTIRFTVLIAVFAAVAPSHAATASWTNRFGTGAEEHIFAAATSPVFGTVVGGVTDGALAAPSRLQQDGFIRRYGLDGRTMWTRQIVLPGSDVVSAVAFARDGGVDAIDRQFVNSAMPSGRAVLVSFDAAGNRRATHWIHQPFADFRAIPDGEGGAFLAGGTYRQERPGVYEQFLRHYDANGRLAWSLPASDHSVQIMRRFGSGFLAAESAPSALTLVAYTSAGRKLWETTMPDVFPTDIATNGHSIALVAYAASRTSGSLANAGSGSFVRTFDQQGRIRWTRGLRNAGATNVGIADDGAVTIAGQPNNSTRQDFLRTYTADGSLSHDIPIRSSDSIEIKLASALGSQVVVAGQTRKYHANSSDPDDVFVSAIPVTRCVSATQDGCSLEPESIVPA